MNRAPNSLFTASFRHFAVDDFSFMPPIVCLVAIDIYRFMYVDSANETFSKSQTEISFLHGWILDDLAHG